MAGAQHSQLCLAAVLSSLVMGEGESGLQKGPWESGMSFGWPVAYSWWTLFKMLEPLHLFWVGLEGITDRSDPGLAAET